MPIYEYQCKNCGRTLEKRQKFSDEPLTVCPYCEGPLEKLISAPAVQFKGGGWYADGYGNKSPSKSTSGDSGSSSSGSSDSSSSSTGTAPSAPASAPVASTPAASTPSSSGTAK
jgi:putative FmdB family regulatory protein